MHIKANPPITIPVVVIKGISPVDASQTNTPPIASTPPVAAAAATFTATALSFAAAAVVNRCVPHPANAKEPAIFDLVSPMSPLINNGYLPQKSFSSGLSYYLEYSEQRSLIL